MFPFSFVGEEINLPRFLLPLLSGKKKGGEKTEDMIKTDNDKEVPKISQDPAGMPWPLSQLTWPGPDDRWVFE